MSLYDDVANEIKVPTRGTVATEKPTVKDVYNFLTEKGLSDTHARGMLANIAQESRFDPQIENPDTGAKGLFQYYKGRKDALYKFAGTDKPSWKQQVEFAMTEPDTQKYLATDFPTAADATVHFLKNWERPGNYEKEVPLRLKKLEAVSNQLSGGQENQATPSSPQPVKNSLKDQVLAEINSGAAPTSDTSTPQLQLPDEPSAPTGVGETATLAKSYLDALGFGALERGIAKIPGAKEASAALNNAILGENKTFDERAQADQEKMKAIEAEHPIMSGAGTVGGIAAQSALLGPIFKALGLATTAGETATNATKLLNAGKKITEGAISSGIYEAGSNPDASIKSVRNAAGIGGLVGTAFEAAKPVLKYGSRALINLATKAGDNEVADYVAKELPQSTSKADLLAKNQKKLTATESKLQDVLNQPKYGNETVNLTELTNDPKFLKDIIDLNEVEQQKASELFDKLIKFNEKGEMLLPDANQLKRTLRSQIDYEKTPQGKINNVGKLYKTLSDQLQAAIEAKGGPEVKSLNQSMSKGIRLKDALESEDPYSSLKGWARNFGETAAAIGGPFTGHPWALPIIATEKAATSVPGSQLIGKAVNAEATPIQTVLTRLLPQLFK